MDLTEYPVYKTSFEGVESYTLGSGDEVKIETVINDDTEDRLGETCPAGKVWDVCISVVIRESDA